MRGSVSTNDGPHGPVSRRVLATEGFVESWSVTPEFSLAGSVERSGRCGIYLLAFEDGDWYVGQAVDVVLRYLDHRKRFENIGRVFFKSVPREELDREEWRLVSLLEDDWRWPCLNIRLSSRPKGPSGLYELVSEDVLTRWKTEPSCILEVGQARAFPELERKLAERKVAMERHPLAEDVRALASQYVRTVVPMPRTTEYDYWSLACHAGQQSELLLRVSMSWQEVFALFAVDDTIEAAFQVAKSGLPSTWFASRLFKLRHPRVSMNPHSYESGGSDQVRLVAIGARAVERLIADPHFIRAAREMNSRLMRKGSVNPGIASSHCAGWVRTLALEDAPRSIAPTPVSTSLPR